MPKCPHCDEIITPHERLRHFKSAHPVAFEDFQNRGRVARETKAAANRAKKGESGEDGSGNKPTIVTAVARSPAAVVFRLGAHTLEIDPGQFFEWYPLAMQTK